MQHICTTLKSTDTWTVTGNVGRNDCMLSAYGSVMSWPPCVNRQSSPIKYNIAVITLTIQNLDLWILWLHSFIASRPPKGPINVQISKLRSGTRHHRWWADSLSQAYRKKVTVLPATYSGGYAPNNMMVRTNGRTVPTMAKMWLVQ